MSTESDAWLLGSNAIDREGAGSNPAAASTFRLVDAIPRAAATLAGYRPGFFGGRPRCPQCVKSGSRVRFCGDALLRLEGRRPDFHCIACLVAWEDSDFALCYVCAEPFRCEPNQHAMPRRPDAKHSTCYHLNAVEHPCCARCEAIVGAVLLKHGRRQLRRMAGLR